MSQFTVYALAGVAVLIGVAALVVLWQILAAVSRRTPNDTEQADRSSSRAIRDSRRA